jgi:hypothetical protein
LGQATLAQRVLPVKLTMMSGPCEDAKMKAAGHLKTMLVSLWIAAPLCVADDASALGYVQLSFGSKQAGYGNGHVQYDRASLTPYYDYRDAWMACEASGDFGPCDELPRWINFGLSITEAELRISGAVFETSDFSWSFYVTGECFIENCGRDYSSINIDNGPDFIWQECDGRYGSITEAGLFKDCGEFEYLDGRINGV